MTFVGDRGLINNKNVNVLIASGYSYILGFKMRSIPKSERFDILAHKKWKSINKELDYRDINYKDQRLVLYYKTLSELKKIHAMTIRIYKMTLVSRTEIKNHAKIAFRALAMAFPKKVLRQENCFIIIVRSD